MQRPGYAECSMSDARRPEYRTPHARGQGPLRRGHWKHGRTSLAAIQQRREVRAALRMIRELLSVL
jgi:hypothetical protein